MNTCLSPTERTKLAKLLALADSDFLGESQNAILAACKMVKAKGLTWDQVLEPPAIEHQEPELGTWRTTARQCLLYPGELSAWERKFLADILNFQRLSTKQRYWLKTIADRVLGADR